MAEQKLVIIDTQETIFFGEDDQGQLCQWINVTIDNPTNQPVQGVLVVEAGGKEIMTDLEITPGIRSYRGYAAVLWPHHSPLPQAPVRLHAGGDTTWATVSVGNHRPWTLYLLADICTDYTWVYDDEASPRAHDAAVTEAELMLADQTEHGSTANCNHYNLVHAREAEFYLERYPDQEQRFFEHVRRGTITFNPFFNMALTGLMSLEELIRQFYPARTWAKQHDLNIGYANHQETPTITWAMAMVLKKCGIHHLVKSILPYECPWAERLEEPPLFFWEGPDGSRILVRRRNVDYVQGSFVLRDLRTTNATIHNAILPHYAELGSAYPFNAIGLVGCYGDLSPTSAELPAKKVETVTAYNSQGWLYPKLVNASHKQFWDHIDSEIETRAISLPIFRGDYGTAWESWPSSLAHDFAGWRRAQERANTADKLTALLCRLDRQWYESHRTQLAEGWMNLLYLNDHAWNGANDANRAFNAVLRRRWQEAANSLFDTLITTGMSALAKQVKTDETEGILIFNGLSWPRSSLARLEHIGDEHEIVDAISGETITTQSDIHEGRQIIYLDAKDVPSIGYRTFTLRQTQKKPTMLHDDIWYFDGNQLEGPLYAVEISPVTGGITSLFDKVRGHQWVDPESPYHLNQCLYLSNGLVANSDGIEYTPQRAKVVLESVGPLFARLRIHALLKNIQLTTTVTLYTNYDRVDIHNAVHKVPTAEKHELNFVFPFHVPDRRYRYEAPGALIAVGEELRPGAGQAVTAVRHFVDVYNDDFGILLSQTDSGLIEFGHRTSAEDPTAPDPTNSTIFTLALGNWINWREVTRDQAGQTDFTFRYSMCGHDGGFDPVRAVRFGWEDNNELLVAMLAKQQDGLLPSGRHSFVSVEPEHAILTTLKVAEEEGLLARLWECSEKSTEATIRVAGMGTLVEARQTDQLENDQVSIAVGNDSVKIPVSGRGLAAVRLLLE
jgi:alpha-mannosidase